MARAVPDAVIFDLDGVLVDSYAAVTGAINAALTEHGLFARPRADLRRFIGPPTGVAFRELTGEHVAPAALAEIVATYHRHYAEVYLAQTSTIEGIVPVLESLSQRLALAIATSKSATFTQPLLDALGLARFFVVVEAARPDDASDEKTAIVARALAGLTALGCRETAMVGDRSFDIDAARAHGLLAIGVAWGIGSPEELEAAGADLVLAAPSELLQLLAAEGPIGR